MIMSVLEINIPSTSIRRVLRDLYLDDYPVIVAQGMTDDIQLPH